MTTHQEKASGTIRWSRVRQGIPVVMVLAVLAIGLAACGAATEAKNSPTSKPATHAQNRNPIHVTASAFSPTAYSIANGAEVTFVNDQSGTSMTVCAGSNGACAAVSGAPTALNGAGLTLTGSGSVIVRFATPGTYHLTVSGHNGANLSLTVSA